MFSRYPRGQRRDTLQKRGICELRTYITSEYKPAALNARFTKHTTKFFLKHGFRNVGYWTPYDRPESENTLIYLIQHESREKADKNWQAFSQDPDWQKVARDSQRQGKLLKRKPERLYLKPLDFRRRNNPQCRHTDSMSLHERFVVKGLPLGGSRFPNQGKEFLCHDWIHQGIPCPFLPRR